MIDTSGSMSESQITECYSEIYGAIGQFNGKLQGKLGFFDAVVVEPIPFEDEEEFKIIRPKGGGGTNFDCIFDFFASVCRFFKNIFLFFRKILQNLLQNFIFWCKIRVTMLPSHIRRKFDFLFMEDN